MLMTSSMNRKGRFDDVISIRQTGASHATKRRKDTMWGYSTQGIKIVHKQMVQEALERRALPRSEKHARRSPLKHLFEGAQAHFTTASTRPTIGSSSLL
jgi:hypothetical protein